MVTDDPNAPRLVVTSPAELTGLTLPLSQPELVIGHSETADLILDDQYVSRRHALLTVDPDGQVTLRDLNSTGGTFVNDERITGAQLLRPGDIVRFADLVARFEPGRPRPELAATQIVPPPSASDTAPDQPGFTVTGTVTGPPRRGVAGLTVELIDKNVGGDQILASTTTNADGSYRFGLAISAGYLAGHHKSQPDLQVGVSSDSRRLATSEVWYSAPATVSLDVTLPASAPGLHSEYETLVARLWTAYPGNLSDLREEQGRRDITYLAGKTGWDARSVALVAFADQFSRHTAPAPAAGQDIQQTQMWPVPTVSLRPEFYYALMRTGVPASLDNLLRVRPAMAEAIWRDAAARGVIPADLTPQVPAAVQDLAALSAAHVLAAPPPVGISTLQQMVAPTLSEAAQQQDFAGLYTQYQGDWAQFWPAVEQRFGSAATQRLQLMGQLFYLTVNNQPLVGALMAAEPSEALGATQDLATLGYYEAAKWLPLIGVDIPPQIPGADAQERAGNYAKLLAAQVRLAFPTTVVADQVRRGILPVTGGSDAAGQVAGFLAEHQGRFEIGVEPVEAYLARIGQTGTPADVVTAVRRIQRAYQLTRDDASLSALLHHNLDSAFAVTRYDPDAFVRAFAGRLGGADVATTIHARARQIFTATLSMAIAYLSARVTPDFGGRSPVQFGYAPPAASSYPGIAHATLENLFGSLDYCDCPDCGSVLSPAAYLVDLLNYLDQFYPAGGGNNPLDVLLQRRPDLQYLPLTCANTNTALPYIDIVNETLEYFVANGLSMDGYQGHDTDGTVASAELLASPQYVNDAAYATLQGAFFPPPLPFSRPLALLRMHLQRLGIALPDAMAALRASDQLTDHSTPVSYGWSDILIEQAGISRDENRLFTDSTLQLGDLYGLPNTTALATLQTMSLQDFSRRLSVSYENLSLILQTRFINPNAALIPRLLRLNAPFNTLKVLHDSLNTPGSIAAQFIAALPAGLDATEYGGTTPADYQAVVNWVTGPSIFPLIMDIITINDPGRNAGDCSGADLQLRYSNPDNTSNLLSGTDFLKLIRFIRLWGKLAPLLSSPDDATGIQRTDDIIAALYPAADLPSGTASDPANRALLDAGFQVLLGRLGFLLRVMGQLSLGGKDLGKLLTCWAPLGTGPGSLYQAMFETPAVLQQDPGAQTATVAASINVGDVLVTGINTPAGQPGQVSYTVQTGDTPATTAVAIAAKINAQTTPDPVTGLPLNERFHATSAGPVITIEAGFTLACAVSAGATETYTATATSPLSQSATVAGTATAGDTITTTINGVLIGYTVVAADTPVSVAVGIAAAINATTIQDPYSGLPLNDLIVASSAAAVITIITANAGPPFTLTCSYTSANAGTYQATPPGLQYWTAMITGTVTPGDTLFTTINLIEISYTATPTDIDAATLATSIAALINTVTDFDDMTGLPLNSEIQATASGGVITITLIDPAAWVWMLDCSVAPGAESYVGAGPFPPTATATVAGIIPAGAVLTTTIDTLPVTYTVVPGDTLASIATAMAQAIDATITTDPRNNLPLNQVVNAWAGGQTITIAASSPFTTFTVDAALAAGGYTAGRHTPPFADDGYGDVLTDPAQTLFGHEHTLCAAFNLTGTEFTLITAALGFDTSAPLTLAGVSAVFRYGWLAHTLGLSVLEFLRLRAVTGLDPFMPLDPGSAAPAEPPVVRFIRLLQVYSAAGLTNAQALYLMWNADISGTSAPATTVVTGLAATLRASCASVEAQFVLRDDPDGSIAQNLMTLVYGATASAFFFGLLNNTFSTSVPYSTPPGQPSLPSPVIAAAGGRLSYNDVTKQLTFTGILDPATQAAIDAATSDPALIAAVARLEAASQQTVGPFFASYPELVPLYQSYVASSEPAAAKRNALLDSLLPILKIRRKQEQALASVTSTAGTDPSFASALLADPTILHADNDVTSAGVTDLVAIEAPGLSAEFFLGNNPAAPPDQSVDTVPLLSYTQTATVGGTVTPGDILTTTINGTAIGYTASSTDTTPALLAARIASAINAATPVSHAVAASAAGPVITISGLDPSGAASYFSLTTAVSAGGTETYTTGSQFPGGGGPIAARWDGYITVPQDGPYDFSVATDPGAGITLQIGGTTIVGQQAGGLWQSQSPVRLVSGALTRFTLTATSLKTTLSVSWQSLGLGWEPIPAQYLYSASLVSRLGNGYLRFLKATSLASALSLSAAEIAGLGTAPDYSVATTDATAIAPGSAVFTPASMTNIGVGSTLVIDSGTAQEKVTVTAVTQTTFTAVAARPHDGTTAPFSIVSQSYPETGHGWLNFLATDGGPDPATAASLADVLKALVDFARIKRALSPNDERLLAVLQNPGATLPGGQSALLSLTGWGQYSVDALLTHFFASTDLASLSPVENFRRVYDAYSIVTGAGLTAPALISAITNAPTATTVGALQSALRARYASADWLTVLRPISDAARILQRDALVAYVLQQLGDAYAQSVITLTTGADAATGDTALTCTSAGGVTVGMLVRGAVIAPATTVTSIAANVITISSGILAAMPAGSQFVAEPASIPFDTPDTLYEYFLIDPQTQPAVETSRIRLALSAVQLFVERILRGIEPQVAAADIDPARWEWMKRYRVWQANREVFLWPENWLYPELRDDQSPFFQQMMSGLLQGDITDDAAAIAYLDYLTGLEGVAKLEPCGMYYVGPVYGSDEAGYVVARTAGAHRKYYFRQLQAGAWTPWTQVPVDCEDMPVTPIIWNGRLFLFWLRIVKQAQPTAADPNQLPGGPVAGYTVAQMQQYTTATTAGQTTGSVAVSAVLCWTEFYNGKWQPAKTSDVRVPTALGLFDPSGPYSVEAAREKIRIVPAQVTGTDPAFQYDPNFTQFGFQLESGLPSSDMLLLAITGTPPLGGFVFHNTHSLPVRFEDVSVVYGIDPDDGNLYPTAVQLGDAIDMPTPGLRSLSPPPDTPWTGGLSGGTFAASYLQTPASTPAYANNILQFNWRPRFTEPQPEPDPSSTWDTPFIYEDRRNLFYVTTTETLVTVGGFFGFGIIPAQIIASDGQGE